jgi:membrane glycosyltransferase
VKKSKFYFKFKVHRLFHELFGRETTTFDLLAVVISSISFAGLTLAQKWNDDISNFKLIILTILALDISGGVVANFTTGTTNYYGESSRKRYVFVLFHLLQPSILIWIFPNELQAIMGISIFTLLCSFIVLNINKHYTQRITAIILLLLSFILSILLNYSDPLLQIVMQLFSIKLILAFSVNWSSIDNDETRIENKKNVPLT